MPNALTPILLPAIRSVVLKFGSATYTGPPDPIVAQTQFITELSTAISEAVILYLNTQVIVLPGQAVVTAGGPTNQAGSTVSPGKLQAP